MNAIQSFDITSQAAGQSQVRLQWYFHGDSSKIFAWCIDDVFLTGSPVPARDVGVEQVLYPPRRIPAVEPCAPTISVVNYGCHPESVTAGVTFTGPGASYQREQTFSLGLGERRIVGFDTCRLPGTVDNELAAWVRASGDEFGDDDTLRTYVKSDASCDWFAVNPSDTVSPPSAGLRAWTRHRATCGLRHYRAIAAIFRHSSRRARAMTMATGTP